MMNKYFSIFFSFFLFLISVYSFAHSQLDSQQSRRLILLIDYISTDYKEAIDPQSKLEKNNPVINQDEYEEMQDFAASAYKLYQNLPSSFHSNKLDKNFLKLQQKIQEKALPKALAEITANIKSNILKHTSFVTFPESYPNLTAGKKIYENHCQSCHGPHGDGNGHLSKNLSPLPRNFLDSDFLEELSPFRVQNTLVVGIPETSMMSYKDILDTKQMWDVSFYVLNLAQSNSSSQGFKISLTQSKNLKSQISISDLSQLTNKELKKWILKNIENFESFDDVLRLMYELRSLESRKIAKQNIEKKSPLDYSISNVTKALSLYKKKAEGASDLILDAYLEGFEKVEHSLKLSNPDLVSKIEKQFIKTRSSLAKEEYFEAKQDINDLLLFLTDAKNNLSTVKKGPNLETSSVNFWGEFITSFTIILREGFEAFLIVVALLSLVKNIGRASARKFIHLAWISAILCGIITYIFITKVIAISGASKEALEAFFTALAVLMLFYTGCWLLSQAELRNWKELIRSKSKLAINEQKMWSIFLLAFIAVYREAAETVLFYNALYITANSSLSIILGFMTGLIVLIGLCLLIYKFNYKLSIQNFFKFTSIMMFSLAVVLSGKTVFELIEANYIKATYIESFIHFSAFGIYPILETLFTQGIILVTSIIVICYFKLLKKRLHLEKSAQI